MKGGELRSFIKEGQREGAGVAMIYANLSKYLDMPQSPESTSSGRQSAYKTHHPTLEQSPEEQHSHSEHQLIRRLVPPRRT